MNQQGRKLFRPHNTCIISVKDFVTKIQDKGKKSEKEELFMSLLDLQGCVTMISYNFLWPN